MTQAFCMHPITGHHAKMRSWLDWNVASHVAFLPAFVRAVTLDPPFYELTLFMIPCICFSVIYHRLGEPRGTQIATMDRIAATVLFAYGLIQIHFSSNLFIKFLCAIFAVIVATTHVSGQIYPHLWQTTHSMGMHVIPGIWCCVVACFNQDVWSW